MDHKTITPPSSVESVDFNQEHGKAKTAPPLGDSLRNALAAAHSKHKQRSSPSVSGTSTPGSELASKSRRYLLTTADDEEIRAILQARLDRQAAGAKATRVRMRDLVFTKRFSTFDRQNPLSAESPFHGFFTLFWLAIALLLVRVAAHNWRMYGSVLGTAEILHIMLDRDILVLALTDGVMVGSTIVALGLQKAVQWEWLSWRRTGWIIQNLWQTFYLFAVLAWTWYREWPWTHTIFIVLHTLVFLMKQHSYAFYNGYLSQLSRRKRLLERKLQELRAVEPTFSDLPSPVTRSLHASGFEASRDTNLLAAKRPPLGPRTLTDPAKESQSHIGAVVSAIDQRKKVDSEDITTFAIAIESELEAINEEINGKATDPSKRYPHNLTVSNWLDYTCLPTLIYELEYPRLERINWWYVAEKTAATLGGIWVMIVVSQAYIYPRVLEIIAMKDAGMTLAERWQEFPWVVSDLLFPMLLEQLLTWWVIWECILNVLAELTHFADRNFYGTWWNSVSWDQYARDWNRPVHNFLLRHVYNSSISSFHLSKTTATFVTFLLSALVHELLMFVLFKKVRGYLFAMQLLQIPLASLSRTKLMKGRKLLGNLMFWIGLFVGPSMLTSLYLIV